MKLSELFEPGKDTLAIYNFMFPRALNEDLPCPSCTSFLDAFDGAARHIMQRVNLAVVAKAELPRILAHAKVRGWRWLRLLSSPDADAQRVPARRRSDPSLLGLRASLHSPRSWTGSSPHRFHRPTVESLRLHAPRTRDRLVSGAELLLMVVGSARTRRSGVPTERGLILSRRCADTLVGE